MVRIVDDGIFPAPREKIWRLNAAHAADMAKIHTSVKSVKSVRKEGNSDVMDLERELAGQRFRQVLKFTANPPDTLTVEFLEGPIGGKMVNTYSNDPQGTKVVCVCDVTSGTMNDEQLKSTILQFLDMVYNEDLQYLGKMA